MNNPGDVDWVEFEWAFIVMAGIWAFLGFYWTEKMREICRASGHSYHFRLPLQQWMVVALGLSIQLGLLLKFASTAQIGWGFFVWMPPLFTWGLLESIKPIADRDP